MKLRCFVAVAAVALVTAFCGGIVGAQEEEGPRGPGQRPPQPPEGRPGLRRPGGPVAADIPAVREEMKRHMEEMRTLLMGQRDLARAILAEVRPLRAQGAEPAQIEEAAKKFAPQAEELAAKIAAAQAAHHENLAKIYKDAREAIVKQLAESIVKRIALRGPQRPPRPEGGEPPRPRPDRGGPPENF